MTSFVRIDYPAVHPGVARFEAAFKSASTLRRSFDSTRGLAAMLLAAVVAALLVVADQVVDTWADGHLLAAWIALWAIGFAALALFAGTARRLATRVVGALDRWSQRLAQARADERVWAIALQDARVMSDLRAALSRHGVDETPQTREEGVAAVARVRVPSLTSRAGRAHQSYYI